MHILTSEVSVNNIGDILEDWNITQLQAASVSV